VVKSEETGPFAAIEEGNALQKSKWKQYDDMYLIIWDMTNITTYYFFLHSGNV
jgi:hypothetical protein